MSRGPIWPDNNVMMRPPGFGLMEKIPPSAGTTRLRQRPAPHGQLPLPCGSGLRPYLFHDPSAWGSHHLSIFQPAVPKIWLECFYTTLYVVQTCSPVLRSATHLYFAACFPSTFLIPAVATKCRHSPTALETRRRGGARREGGLSSITRRGGGLVRCALSFLLSASSLSLSLSLSLFLFLFFCRLHAWIGAMPVLRRWIA